MGIFQQAQIKDIKSILSRFIKKGQPQVITPYLVGFPGIGKSQTVAEFAQENGYQLIDLRLSQCLETDLLGIPRDGSDPSFCEWKPPVNIPWESNKAFKNTRGILFLDELPQADEAVIKASFQLIYDHAVGGHRIHKDWYIVAAGNLGTEDGNDGLTMFPTALKDRLAIIHIDRDSCSHSWIDYATTRGLCPEIVGYLRLKPEKLYHEFNAQGEKIFCTPRRWEKLCRLWEQNQDMTLPQFIEDLGPYLIYDLVPEVLKYLEDNKLILPEHVLYQYAQCKTRLQKMKSTSEEAIMDLAMKVSTYILDHMERNKKGEWFLENETKTVRNNIMSFLKLLRDDQVFAFMRELAMRGGFRVLDLLNVRLAEHDPEFWDYHLSLIPEDQKPDKNLNLIEIRNELRANKDTIIESIRAELSSRMGKELTIDKLIKMAQEQVSK